MDINTLSSRVLGGVIWLLFPLLLVNLALTPWSGYGMPLSDVVVTGGMFFGAFIFLTLVSNSQAESHEHKESVALGPVTVNVSAKSSGRLNFAYIFYTAIFVVLTVVVGWTVYQKYLLITTGHASIRPDMFLVIDCYAIFLIGQNIFDHIRKKRARA